MELITRKRSLIAIVEEWIQMEIHDSFIVDSRERNDERSEDDGLCQLFPNGCCIHDQTIEI